MEVQALEANRFGGQSKLRCSRAWLWWKYVNYCGEGGCGGGCLLVVGAPFLALSLFALAYVVSSEVPFWINGQRTLATITNKSKQEHRGHKGGTYIRHVVSYEFRDAKGNLQRGEGA